MMWVGPKKEKGYSRFPMKCLQVKEEGSEVFGNFYGHIEGFDWEPGYNYTLKVKRTKIDPPIPDRSIYDYKLITIIEKNKA